MKFLIVHENEKIRSELVKIVSKFNSIQIIQTTPEKALDELKQDNFDCIITGLIMHKNGLDLILNINQLALSLKIFAISEHENEMGIAPAAERLGAHKVFSYPLNRKEIETAIKDIINGD